MKGTKRDKRRSRLGLDLEEAFTEMAAWLRGEVEAEHYTAPAGVLTPVRIKTIRRSIASSTREFEKRFGVPARTMEAYEQGRRKPDAAMEALLRIIEREPDAVRRALASEAA